MQEPHDLIEKFVKPWLAKNHPDADIVFLAGSYGRAMKAGNFQPIASSDIDLVIIYADLEKGGFKAATQVFTMEDVGSALGEAPRIMMVDTNIHDLVSLHYHDKVVKESMNIPFINAMLSEGYILTDKTGIGSVLQQHAAQFLAEGPLPVPQDRWQADISRMETFLRDIHAAESIEERRFLGAMALKPLCNFALGIHQSWRSGINQSYRSLSTRFSEDAEKITAAFSDLIRHGESGQAEALLEDYIRQGKALLPSLPTEDRPLLYAVEKYVPQAESVELRDMFLKFMMEHMCETLETSKKRGELAHLENLSATVLGIKAVLEANDNTAPADGLAGLRYLGLRQPDLMPVTLQALDEGLFDPLRKLAGDALVHMGGLHYTRLENYYPDDVARVRAVGGAPIARKKFTPSFKP